MNRALPALLAGLVALLPSPAAAADAALRWQLDPVHTQVWVEVSHQGYSRPLGRVPVSAGVLEFDPDALAAGRAEVVLDMAGLDFGDAGWNRAVRGRALLHAGRWPQARFSSESIRMLDARRGIVRGTLELRGIRRPLELEFTLNRIAVDPYRFRRTAGFSATGGLRRSDFGMRRFADVIGDEIRLRVEAEAVLRDDARNPEPEEPAP